MTEEDAKKRLFSRRNVLRGAAIGVTGTVATRNETPASARDFHGLAIESDTHDEFWNEHYKKGEFDRWFTDPDAVHSSPESFKVWTNAGNHYGMDAKVDPVDGGDYTPTDCQEMFVQFYVDFDGTIDENPAEMKGPGFCNIEDGTGYAGNPSTGGGWSVRMPYWSNDGDTSNVGLSYYVYHVDQRGPYGEWENIAQIGTEGYHKIDQHVRLNTVSNGTANADGELRCWIDDNKRYERTNLRFSHAPRQFYAKQWMMLYHGGDEVATTYVETRFDDIRIDTRNFAGLTL